MARLRLLKNKADDPLLLPTLAAGIWMEFLQEQNYQSGKKLREIQDEIGLMSPYLQSQQIFKQPIKLEEVHQQIISQHAFLTNGMSEFVADLFSSTKKAMHTL